MVINCIYLQGALNTRQIYMYIMLHAQADVFHLDASVLRTASLNPNTNTSHKILVNSV